jgi:hypothetical protein
MSSAQGMMLLLLLWLVSRRGSDEMRAISRAGSKLRETLREESRLGVGHGAETADESICDDALPALKDTDLEMGVLWSLEDLMGQRADNERRPTTKAHAPWCSGLWKPLEGKVGSV